MEKNLSNFIIDGKLVVKYESGEIDGGDSLNLTSNFYFLIAILNNFKSDPKLISYMQGGFRYVLKQFEFALGDYFRYPDTKWIYIETRLPLILKDTIKRLFGSLRDTNTGYDMVKWATSRDQKKPLMTTLSLLQMNLELKRILIKQIKRVGRYQNLDWSVLNEISIYERCFGTFFGRAFLWVGDFAGFIDTIFAVFKTNKNDNDVAIWVNHLQSLLYSRYHRPTLWSELSLRYCRKYGNPRGEKTIFHYAIKKYFAPSYAPPLDLLYIQAIDKYLN